MDGKSSIQNAEIEHFLHIFANWKCPMFESVQWSDREIFLSPNFCKFAIECDWSNKISWNIQNFGFFGKIDGRFWKKTWVFLKIVKWGKFGVNGVSNDVFW